MHNDLINKNLQQHVWINYIHALILPVSWFDWVSLSSTPHFSRCHGFGTVCSDTTATALIASTPSVTVNVSAEPTRKR